MGKGRWLGCLFSKYLSGAFMCNMSNFEMGDGIIGGGGYLGQRVLDGKVLWLSAEGTERELP